MSFDRLSGDVAYRKRRAALGIAVHLRQDHSSQSKPSMKFLRRVHRVLAGHGIGNEQDFLRIEQLLQLLHLRHQLFVHVQASRRVHDQGVKAEVAGLAPGFRRQPLYQGRAGFFALHVAFVDLGVNGFGHNPRCSPPGGTRRPTRE